MSDQIYTFYQKWVESKEYQQQSVIENNTHKDYEEKIKGLIGKKQFDDIEDDVFELASEAEQSGFINGFKYGVLFIAEILKTDTSPAN